MIGVLAAPFLSSFKVLFKGIYMHTHQFPSYRLARRLALTGLVLGAALNAVAADPRDASQFRQDMQSCRDGGAPQSRSDCERETRNAYAESRRGGLTSPTDTSNEQAQRRCSVFQREGDNADCMARMGGGALVSGSVNGGGLIREATTPAPSR